MKFPSNIPVYGDMAYRGECPSENAEQVTFFNRLRAEFPDTYGKIGLHPKNEGKRSYNQAAWDKASGMTTGASDVIIPTGFVCEIKRRDHTKSKWQKGQQDYLQAAAGLGAFACVALGADAAWQAFNEWRLRSPLMED